MAIILFDFDGVLADTLDDALNFGRQACAQMGFERNPTPADLDALDTMSVPDFGRQLELPPQYIDEFTARYLHLFDLKTNPPGLFQGMKKVIVSAAKNNIIAILTSNTTLTVETFLKEYKLQPYIKLVIGVEQKGSKAEKIQIARKRLGRVDEEAYMIGDSVSDIRAAREASIKSIAVGWGHQSLTHLRAASHDYLVPSPAELRRLLEKVNSQKNS